MSPLDIYEPPHGDRVKGAEHPQADPLAQVQECTVAPLPCLRVVTIPKECISSMWIVVWPIFSSSLNSMQRVATGVEDCPKLAHHGCVQVGMRELTVLPLCSHDVLGHELCTTRLSVHGQCSPHLPTNCWPRCLPLQVPAHRGREEQEARRAWYSG